MQVGQEKYCKKVLYHILFTGSWLKLSAFHNVTQGTGQSTNEIEIIISK